MLQCRHRRWLVASLLSAAAGSALVGLPWLRAQDAADSGGAAADDAPAGVSVPDSPAAGDLLQKAAEKERQQQWAAAADDYQDVLSKFAGRVVSSHIDADAALYSYQGVALSVQERLARWPAAGLAAYGSAYGGRAAEALAAAGPRDVAALQSIFWNYFVTDAGKSAGIALIDLNIEAGRFATAAWVGQRLLDLHPTLTVERPAVLFRTAAARHFLGDDAAAGRLQRELASKFAGAVGKIGGKDVVLADALAKLLAAPGPTVVNSPGDADHWPQFGGPGGWGGISPSTASPGASITRIELLAPTIGPIDATRRQLYQQEDESDLSQGQGLGIMPVSDGNTLFFQDGRHLYAVNADTGRPLDAWQQTYPGSSSFSAGASVIDVSAGGERHSNAGIYTLDALGRARGEQLTVTVTADSVLALMNQRDRAAVVMGQIALTGPGSGPKLVCLDRATGKERWTRTASDLPESAGPVRNGDLIGEAVVVPAPDTSPGGQNAGDSVLICASGGGRERAFTDTYVVCLSAASGQYRWSTYVGSASEGFEGEPGLDIVDTPQLAVDEGRVLVLSNSGTIAALEPADGRMLWLSAYPRTTIDTREAAANFLRARINGANNPNGLGMGMRPWTQSPILTEAGKAFILPSDGKDLLVYDVASGGELKRIATDDYDKASVLLGVRGGVALLTSDRGCFAVDTTAYDASDPSKAIVWDRKPDEGFADTIAGDENTIFGRGFMTADSVFIPTRHRLYQLSWSKGGKVMAMYPSRGAWAGGQEPGNVLVTGQKVIVAGSHAVDVYTDAELVRRRYEAKIAANPGDPGPRVALAEALFNAGQPEAALANLDQAIELMGGKAAMRSGAGRRLIFSASLDFARHLAADATAAASTSGVAPGDTDVTPTVNADALFDRAGAAAESAAEESTYRLARAGFDRDRKDFSAEVTLCQQVLSDPAMRAIGGDEATADIAGAVAADPSAYAAVEQAAAAALAAARAKGDPAGLAEVAAEYPNAKAAIAAWEGAADLYENHADYAAALGMLRQVYGSAAFSSAGGDSGERARLLMAMARDLAATPVSAGGGAGAALDRLTVAIRYAGPKAALDKAIATPAIAAGTPLAAAVVALRHEQDRISMERMPDFGIPPLVRGHYLAFTSQNPPTIEHVTALLRPARAYSRMDRIVTWSPLVPAAGVVVYPAGGTNALWAVADVGQQPGGVAWMGAGTEAGGGPARLAVWNDSRVCVYEDGSGKQVWQLGLDGLAPVEVASGAEVVSDAMPGMGGDADNMNGQFVPPGRAFRIGRNGVVVRFNNNIVIPAGLVANMAPAPADATERIVGVQPAGDRLVVVTSSGQLIGVAADDGHVVWQFRLDMRAADSVISNAHFVVVRSDDDGNGALLAALDTQSGRVIGRRRFGPNGTPGQLVNAALSEDGTLAMTLSNRLLIKDLYEPWVVLPLELPTRTNADVANFGGMDGPEQLVIHDGRVLALYDAGASIRVHDLTARGDADERDPLSTGAIGNSGVGNGTGPVAWMELVGPRLYAFHSRSYAQYNLSNPKDNYLKAPYTMDYDPRIRDAFLGKDHVILLNEPIDRGPAAGATFDLLQVYSRAHVSATVKRESGLLEYAQTVQDAAGILAWQAMDGGLCYLSADQKLHLLLGPVGEQRPVR